MLGGARRLAITVVCTTVALAAPTLGADGSIAQNAVVSPAPAKFTPHAVDSTGVPNAAVYAFNQIGGTMYAGGTFDTVQQTTTGSGIARQSLFAFDATTGSISSFAPQIDGPVWALASDGTSLYVGGAFSTINGVARRGLAKINPTTGVVDPTFNAGFKAGNVSEIRLVNGRLLVGGTFAGQLLALSPTTGANTGYINIPITGKVANKDGALNSGPTEVYKFAVTPDGQRLVAIGNFTTVANASRPRAFMLDLGTTASLDPWNYPPLAHACRATSLPDQLRDVDFAPDGSYFVIVATGWVPQDQYRLDSQGVPLNTDICDVAARFNTNVPAPAKPVWTNYTGGDTLHSVSVTGAAVYVQGHMRWLDNPYGVDSLGQGGVARPGIGALDPATGHTFADWNPGKTRGVGGKDLYATAAGLWVGSDGRRFAGAVHDSIAFLPLP